MTFRQELEQLINKHSIENRSNTPDFILMEYIMGCLDSWTMAINLRDTWYNKDSDKPIQPL